MKAEEEAREAENLTEEEARLKVANLIILMKVVDLFTID